ncbi:MAG: SMC family ATPase [Gemmataceae bacterium]
MIPQRVRLRGFLCYKDEQAIEFDGNATLWMLCGLNGSGKSAIFDALTYALFGHHRGGGTHASELINKDSDTLVVEFDFLLDGRLYRIRRTLRRDAKGGARGTQQIFRMEEGNLIPVEGTGQRREFDTWIEDNIGLTYETFTSSVLLLQGKAEKLLDSKPEGRREVLASIVDLSRYERLHQKTDEKRKTLEGHLKGLASRLAALPTVEPLEMAEAKANIEEAEQARTTSRAEVERLVALESESRAWREVVTQLKQVRGRWQKAQSTLADASKIEQAAARLRELREVLPNLREVASNRSLIKQADDHVANYQRQQREKTETLAIAENNRKQAREKRAQLEHLKFRDEEERNQVQTRLRSSSTQLRDLEQCEQLETDLAHLREQLNRQPGDPVEALKAAREAFERIDALDRVLPTLDRFRQRRAELQSAINTEQSSRQQMEVVRAKGEGLRAERTRLEPLTRTAAHTLQTARDAATEALTLLSQAEQAYEELLQIDGAKLCRHCGQALTPAHLGEEKRRRARGVQHAETRARETAKALEMARIEEMRLSQELKQSDSAYQTARDEYRDLANASRTAQQAVQRMQQECSDLWNELPAAQRTRIAPSPPGDWGGTTYPEESALEQLRGQVRELEQARRRLREAERQLSAYEQLRAKEAQILEGINRLLRDLPRDRTRIRSTHAELEARENALFKNIDALRKQISEADTGINRIDEDCKGYHAELQRVERQLRERQLEKAAAERALANHMKLLPATWHRLAESIGLRELHELDGERKHLEEEQTDDLARDLDHARRHVTLLEQEVRQLEEKEARFPAEARNEPAVLAALMSAARGNEKTSDDRLSQAQQRLALLDSYLKQRAQLDEEYRQVESEVVIYRLLADLLGKDRLQLYLVRQAERQVVEYANAVLDRLSGGHLYLQLSGEASGEGNSAKALDLVAFNRTTGERPINVAFLSGSQKFRVAVSLALGIGQYASRQHRPIESVIIDEGFGCLDNQGRQVMIQELQNLRSQMRCILLVSHQEDFAEAFSDGYQFRLEDGATRVTRFQK